MAREHLQPTRCYSAELKAEAVRRRLHHQEPWKQIMQELGIRSSYCLRSWVRRALEDGTAPLPPGPEPAEGGRLADLELERSVQMIEPRGLTSLMLKDPRTRATYFVDYPSAWPKARAVEEFARFRSEHDVRPWESVELG